MPHLIFVEFFVANFKAQLCEFVINPDDPPAGTGLI